MEIVIAAQGLPFSPKTIEAKSLGGSETAALMMARELRKQGHLVTIFCNLPPSGQSDHVESGFMDDLGTRWVNFDQFIPFITNTEVDFLIVSRNPDLFNITHQAKKSILWLHDLATYDQFLPKMMNVSWNFNEVWTVSEFHRQQVHLVTEYPLERIKATRNGIVKFDDIISTPKIQRSLLYSARPERGLEHLVKKGGIMEQLPEFQLNVTMYANYPEHMMAYYTMLWKQCQDLPNVELLGPKTQKELRQLMAGTWAYIYPTEFEEVSCIIAREAMEQQCPFITTKIGALPETLEDCALYVEGEKGEIGSEDFCKRFVHEVKSLASDLDRYEQLRTKCADRKDLYWDKVAETWIDWSEPKKPRPYSLIRSLIEDSDIIAAKAVYESLHQDQRDDGSRKQYEQLKHLYPYLFGKETFKEYYNRYYLTHEDKKRDGRGARVNPVTQAPIRQSQRYQSIRQAIASLPQGAEVLDYGCAEGVIILHLAQDFPDKLFTGVDFVESNVELCYKYAEELDLKNVRFLEGDIDNWPDMHLDDGQFDALICTEVLEHVEKPWELITQLEEKIKNGGQVVITTPLGPWESVGLYNKDEWYWRAHIWHIDKWMLREMFHDKEQCMLSNLTETVSRDGRSLGHSVMIYASDDNPAREIDPQKKATQHRCRQTISAAMIAMNDEEEILKCLNSIHLDVCQIHIALGPSNDHTEKYINQWAVEHPWIDFKIKKVPKIEVGKYGFDDARNESIKDIDADWILWIDSDEYLSGKHLKAYARDNAYDSYALHQHHFTCDPRGAPAQLDKPARLIRNFHRFEFFGKVHEHAEMGFNGGPGFVMVIADVDIGHTGYTNEDVRRDRFSRNFPLLQWDQDVYPDRKLGKYLWLRDMIHRMRLFAQSNPQETRRLAEEAILFYQLNSDKFSAVGGGNFGNNAIAYYSEAMKFLGRGMPVEIMIKLEGKEAMYSGIFETADDVFEIGKHAVEEEFVKNKSGY